MKDKKIGKASHTGGGEEQKKVAKVEEKVEKVEECDECEFTSDNAIVLSTTNFTSNSQTQSSSEQPSVVTESSGRVQITLSKPSPSVSQSEFEPIIPTESIIISDGPTGVTVRTNDGVMLTNPNLPIQIKFPGKKQSEDAENVSVKFSFGEEEEQENEIDDNLIDNSVTSSVITTPSVPPTFASLPVFEKDIFTTTERVYNGILTPGEIIETVKEENRSSEASGTSEAIRAEIVKFTTLLPSSVTMNTSRKTITATESGQEDLQKLNAIEDDFSQPMPRLDDIPEELGQSVTSRATTLRVEPSVITDRITTLATERETLAQTTSIPLVNTEPTLTGNNLNNGRTEVSEMSSVNQKEDNFNKVMTESNSSSTERNNPNEDDIIRGTTEAGKSSTTKNTDQERDDINEVTTKANELSEMRNNSNEDDFNQEMTEVIIVSTSMNPNQRENILSEVMTEASVLSNDQKENDLNKGSTETMLSTSTLKITTEVSMLSTVKNNVQKENVLTEVVTEATMGSVENTDQEEDNIVKGRTEANILSTVTYDQKENDLKEDSQLSNQEEDDRSDDTKEATTNRDVVSDDSVAGGDWSGLGGEISGLEKQPDTSPTIGITGPQIIIKKTTSTESPIKLKTSLATTQIEEVSLETTTTTRSSSTNTLDTTKPRTSGPLPTAAKPTLTNILIPDLTSQSSQAVLDEPTTIKLPIPDSSSELTTMVSLSSTKLGEGSISSVRLEETNPLPRERESAGVTQNQGISTQTSSGNGAKVLGTTESYSGTESTRRPPTTIENNTVRRDPTRSPVENSVTSSSDRSVPVTGVSDSSSTERSGDRSDVERGPPQPRRDDGAVEGRDWRQQRDFILQTTSNIRP